MLTNINPYLMNWNTDVNGNPIAIHKQEVQQVSPVYFNIQLDEIPDSFHRLSVVDMEGKLYHEVDHRSKLTEDSYHVDYNGGVVYFHHSQGAKIVEVTYYGRGYKLIHSSRIVMEDGSKLSDALTQVQTISRSLDSESNTSTRKQIDELYKFVRKQQRQIDLLLNAIEELQNK